MNFAHRPRHATAVAYRVLLDAASDVTTAYALPPSAMKARGSPAVGLAAAAHWFR